LQRRADAAAKYVDPDRLAISPQCGFASTVAGNPITEADMRAKLALCVDAAAKYVPLERLAISPQCGFASDVVGNLLTEEEQRRKLELVVEAARAIWNQ